MNREIQSLIVAMLGGVLLGVTVSGRYTSYVRPGFGPLLIAGGAVCLCLGVVSGVQSVRRRLRVADVRSVPRDACGHVGHDHGSSRASWLMLLPIGVLVLAAPTALGSDAVARAGQSQAIDGLPAPPAAQTAYDGYPPNHGDGSIVDAPAGGPAAAVAPPQGRPPAIGDRVVTVKDFVLSALYGKPMNVTGKPVTVVGFVASAADGYDRGYTIARLAISCCAADARPIRLHVDGRQPFPNDTWVAALVTAVPNSATDGNDYVPTVRVTGIERVQTPSDPYEH